uniref:Spindle assembly abnormal protein 6 homolog n=1 Tax=Scleropages formosus TaxID=113540 RepID=A0A8C9S9P8_SCLFO
MQFYSAVIESVLCTSITVWFGSATKSDIRRLQQIVRTAGRIIGTPPQLSKNCTRPGSVKGLDLLVRLTDDSDPCFLYSLVISEEDFQSLKVQQSLMFDFSAFPQKIIELLNLCIAEKRKDCPCYSLQLISPSQGLDHSHANLIFVQINEYRQYPLLSLKLFHGTDLEIKKYLADCMSNLKEEKQLLEQKLKRTEEDLTRQLSYTQQTLAEKSRELDKLRSEWTSQTSALSSQHSQDLTAEREKALEIQTKLQQQNDQLRKELESTHLKNMQHFQGRIAELETFNRDLTEKKMEADCSNRDLKAKLVALEEECQRAKQQMTSLRREKGTLNQECLEKERQVNQLQTRVAILERDVKDKDQLVLSTKEVLEGTQEQKATVEAKAESKQLQIEKLEATVKSLSEDLNKANSIIKKLLEDMKVLAGKNKLKNIVIVKQEKVVEETTDRLHKEQKELEDTRQQLKHREEEVLKLKEQLEATLQKLDESKEVLKTNEQVINWLNKQLNESHLTSKPESVGLFQTPLAQSSAAGRPFLPGPGPLYPITSTLNSKPPCPLSGGSSDTRTIFPQHSQGGSLLSLSTSREPVGLESKYLERREDSIPLRGLLPNAQVCRGENQPALHLTPSAYFPG